MANVFNAVKVVEGVYWVGAVDWGVRDFHGYATKRGTTYNAFLVLGQKTVLVDTVKKPFFGEMMARVASVVDPASIDVIISHHAEMDHSGCLPEAAAAIRPERILASEQGVKALSMHFGALPGLEAVAEGTVFDAGGFTFHFMETRMLHWPDSMFSYLPERNLLFSQDGFGMHLASAQRFADELDEKVLREEAARYYGNILLPYSPLVLKLAEKVAASGLRLDVIAPDHGPIWRRDTGRILNLYVEWASQKPTRKAVVVYDTMWGSTEKMARAIEEGLSAGGALPKLMPLSGNHRSDVATEILEAGALVVGSPTLNNQLFPTVADVLCYLKGLKRKGLVGASFGSYGWAGKIVQQLDEQLKGLGVELVGEGVQVQYVPTAAALLPCVELGRKVAGRLTGSLS